MSHFVSKYVHEENIGALKGKLNHHYEIDWLTQEFYTWKNGTEAHYRVINPLFQISCYLCPVILNFLCSARMDPDGVKLSLPVDSSYLMVMFCTIYLKQKDQDELEATYSDPFAVAPSTKEIHIVEFLS